MKLTKRQLKRIIKEELGRVMEAITPDDLFAQGLDDAATAGPVFATIESGRGAPVDVSKAVLEQALKNHFDSIPTTEPVDEARRIASRDAIVRGLLHKDVLPTWTRLPPMSWQEELLDQARDIGTRGPDPLSPSLFDERWAESWVDRWALISKNGAVPDLIKKEIRKIKDEKGIIPQ